MYLGKKIYKLFFGVEKRHLNKKFNDWRFSIFCKGLEKNPALKKQIESIPQKYINDHWVRDEMGPDYKKLMTRIRAAKTIEFVSSFVNVSKKQKILDAGASDGLFLYPFDGELVGLNIEWVCAKRIGAEGFTGVKGDITKMPFDSDYFDAVFCFEVIEHLEDPIRTVRELCRVSKKHVFLSTPYSSHTRIEVFNSEKEKASTNQHVFMFAFNEIRNLFSYTDFLEKGFVIIDPLQICKVSFLDKILAWVMGISFPKWVLVNYEKK
jgi:SAM-dependent methyltransferase